MLKKIRILPVVIIMILCIALFAGCNKDEEYTIDEPFDFGSLSDDTVPDDSTTEGNGSETGDEITGTEATPESGNQTQTDNQQNSNSGSEVKPTTPANSDSSISSEDGDILPTVTPTQAPSSGNTSTGSSGSGNTNSDVVEDESFSDVAEDNKVPDTIVDKMTAKALLETYMSYPMYNILCFEQNPLETYEKWLDDMDNCVEELLERDSAVEVILDKYKTMVAQQTKEHLKEEKDFDAELKLDWIELLLLQDDVKEAASLAQQKEILAQAELRDENNLSNGYAITDIYPSLAEAYKLG